MPECSSAQPLDPPIKPASTKLTTSLAALPNAVCQSARSSWSVSLRTTIECQPSKPAIPAAAPASSAPQNENTNWCGTSVRLQEIAIELTPAAERSVSRADHVASLLEGSRHANIAIAIAGKNSWLIPSASAALIAHTTGAHIVNVGTRRIRTREPTSATTSSHGKAACVGIPSLTAARTSTAPRPTSVVGRSAV